MCRWGIGRSRDGAGQIKQGNVGQGMPKWREYSQWWTPTGSVLFPLLIPENKSLTITSKLQKPAS